MPARPPTATAETTYFVNRDSRGRRAEVASNPSDPTSMPAHVESVRPSGIRRDADQLADPGRVPGHVRLTEADLGRRILDCPGGTASFTAEVNAAGGDAIACDAIYPQYAPNVLAARSVSATERGNGYVRAHPEQYRWSCFAPFTVQRSVG